MGANVIMSTWPAREEISEQQTSLSRPDLKNSYEFCDSLEILDCSKSQVDRSERNTNVANNDDAY